MTFEEWRDMTRIMIDFNSLSAQDQERILLMIDGLRFRQTLRDLGEDK